MSPPDKAISLPGRSSGSVWTALVGPGGWRAVAWPGLFATAALALLVYDHLHERITHPVFWLCVGLIACVFAWLVETARRQSMALSSERREKLRDAITGLPNRAALQSDLSWTLSGQRERRTLVVLELEGLQAYYDDLGGAAGDRLVLQIGGRLAEAVTEIGGNAYRIDSIRFAALIPSDGRAFGEILLAAVSSLPEDHTSELLIGRSSGEVSLPDEADDPELALQIAGQHVAESKQRQQRSARRQAHAVLMAVLNARRPELRQHLRSIAYRSISLSRRLGLDRHAIDDVFLASELQDVGLLTVPEAVLEKKGPLDAAEASLIRNHPVAGERIVASAPGLASVAALVRATSERFDGRGYPDGLAGDEIPLGSRIIAVCVAFAAMSSTRPYQAARAESDVLAELQRCAGSQFDPVVVEALIAELAEERAPAGVPGLVPDGAPGPESSPDKHRVPATLLGPGEAD